MCCQSMNMTLVEIESANEQARILNITMLIQAPFFIGLNQSCDINNYSVWLSGKPITFSSLGMYPCFVYITIPKENKVHRLISLSSISNSSDC